MKGSFLKCFFVILTMLAFTVKVARGEVKDNFVVIHCTTPGTLEISEDAKYTPFLKVTGDIDARDFNTLKNVTISVTRTLDLSDAVIHEYTGNDGCIAQGSSGGDWMVGDEDNKQIVYPADTFPIDAFSEWRNNTISGFSRGSSTLTRLILPSTLKGFMKRSFTPYSILVDLEVPATSTTIKGDGHVVYSYDGKQLLAVAPAFYGNIEIAPEVTTVSATAFESCKPASVRFKSDTMPEFPDDCTLQTAYILAPNPEAYQERFPDIDCVAKLEPITIDDAQPGELLSMIGDKGFSRSQVRSVKIGGTINLNDLNQLAALPALHVADLSDATLALEGFSSSFLLDNPSITEFLFPKMKGSLSLRLGDQASLFGNLSVPEGVYVFTTRTKRISSAIFPSTLLQVGDYLFGEYSVLEEIDFSRCNQLNEVKNLDYTQRLRIVKLPESLTSLYGCFGPVREINLPSGLTKLRIGDWLIEDMELPKSLEEAVIYSMPFLKNLDASKAVSLYSLYGLANTPNLKTLDLRNCPLRNVESLFGIVNSSSLVVSGGTKYPAPSKRCIERIYLPSTIEKINAFTDCPNLKEMDLMHCYRLKEIAAFNNCENLETVTLPENVTTLQGFSGCVNLKNVKSAAKVPPVYSTKSEEALDFSNITLTVPQGCGGAYRMADGWESCRDIIAEGYVVSISGKSYESVVNNPARTLVYGAGLYTAGTEVELNAMTNSVFHATGWDVNGNSFDTNPCKIKVDKNILAEPLYEIDTDLCDIKMVVDLPVDQKVKIGIGSYERIMYVDGKKNAQNRYNSYSEDIYTINLGAGRHEIGFTGRSIYLMFYSPDETLDSSEFYKVISFDLNNKAVLSMLYPGNFDMDELDLAGAANLNYISSRGNNRISALNISHCPSLEDIYIYDAQLQKIQFEDTPLEDIRLGYNLLSSIDLTGLDNLQYLDLDHNLLTDFKMNGERCRFLDLAYNPMTFSTLTDTMYEIYMRQKEEQGTEEYTIPFIPDLTGVDDTGIIDLAPQLKLSRAGSEDVVKVWINGELAPEPEEYGKYHLPMGYSQIILTNDAYPTLSYMANVHCQYSAVAEVEADSGNHITISATGGDCYRIEGIPVSSEGAKLKIFNMNGLELYSATTKESAMTVNLGDLPPGIYMLWANGNKQVKTLKFIHK